MKNLLNLFFFQAKRFNRKANCEYCRDRIWGLGRQGNNYMLKKYLLYFPLNLISISFF